LDIKLHDKGALISIARNADKPVAFLVGAPLSEDSGGGVPGVSPMLSLVSAEVRARDSSQLSRYEAALAGKSGSDAYQAALEWLQANFGQSAVNRVVHAAVLKARKAASSATFYGDGAAGEWYIPNGTRQLALLVCSDRERYPGPLLTTNFDPLLSLAIEEGGGQAHLRVIQSDGGLAYDVKPLGSIDVVHLHGYWRDSDTLHTPAQLTASRPRLRAALQQILKQRTLIVAAYGGWDDVFARALAEVAVDDASEVNVLWCFRDTEIGEVKRKYTTLFERVEPAIIRGRFLAYGGIDCHAIFGEIGAFPPTAPLAKMVLSCPLAGWQRTNSAYLSALPKLRPEEVIRYFDGAVPTWRHAVSDAIPRRQAVTDVTNRLAKLQLGKDDCSLQLIRAAGGEGKTTLLLQAACDAVQSGEWIVLWRPSPHVGLPPEHVVGLDTTKQWLIVADDAENIVVDLAESARFLHEAGRSNVHFLLAARDTDWRFFRGDNPPWDTWLKRQKDILLRGITRGDAKSVVEAWRKCGADGLRELAALASADEQVTALVDAVKDAAQIRDEGSLFGGLLTVRFGQQGLSAHVRSLLNHLKEEAIEGSTRSLFDALVYVAACHAVGIPGLDENVLADLVGVPRDWVQSRVVRQLGEETAGVQSAGHVLTRHSKVAAAVLVEADQSLGVDLAEIWSAVVRQTVRTSRDVSVGYQSHAKIVHAGPRLQKALPKQLSEERRKEIAIATANAVVEAEPDRLDFITDLGRTHRFADSFIDAVQVFRNNLADARSKVDYEDNIRGYWYEWSVCEGESGDEPENALTNAWLGGLSLADHLNPGPITEEQAKLSCAGLGLAFGKLAQPRQDCPFALGRRAATYLGRRGGYDPKAHFFDRHDREANKIGTPHPKDVKEAIAWLTTAVAQAGHELQDAFLSNLEDPDHVSFMTLEVFLAN